MRRNSNAVVASRSTSEIMADRATFCDEFSRDRVNPSKESNPQVFFEIEVAGKRAGRIVMEVRIVYSIRARGL